MKQQLCITLMLFIANLGAQTVTPHQVINSAGQDRVLGNSNIVITDNIGEPFTQAVSSGNFLITQGFLQPDVISPGGFTVNVISQDLKCIDKEDDAFISVEIVTPVKNYTASYVWSPNGLCSKGNSCNYVDSLKAGLYSVDILISYKNSIGTLKTDTIKKSIIINNATEPCKVNVFTGVTPNNDGVNDVWTIANILEFPNNDVVIFNRWGQKVYEGKSYNNNERAWPSKDELSKTPSSTYFYILNLGDGSKPIKGWIELMKD